MTECIFLESGVFICTNRASLCHFSLLPCARRLSLAVLSDTYAVVNKPRQPRPLAPDHIYPDVGMPRSNSVTRLRNAFTSCSELNFKNTPERANDLSSFAF